MICAAVPDAAVPDAAVPDAAVPDAAVSKWCSVDTTVPDAAVPDAAVPDIQADDLHTHMHWHGQSKRVPKTSGDLAFWMADQSIMRGSLHTGVLSQNAFWMLVQR